jgi:hypothetical protein
LVLRAAAYTRISSHRTDPSSYRKEEYYSIPLSISTTGGLGCGFKRVFDLLVKHAA